MKLAEKIRIIRKARGMSQEQLGYALSESGISRQSISKWENGDTEPTLDNIRTLAKIFNVSFDALLDEDLDLNDSATLAAILNKEGFAVRKNIFSTTKYHIYQKLLKKKAIKRFIIKSLIALAFGVVGAVILALWATVEQKHNVFMLVAGIVLIMMGLSLFISFLKLAFINRYERVYVGVLDDRALRLNTGNIGDGTIYIPLDKIEKVEITDAKENEVGIFVLGRAKPIRYPYIVQPEKLLQYWAGLRDFIENPDGIKTL